MDPFFFGAATSSHQVEGGTHNDWSLWEKSNAARLAAASDGMYPPENYISGKACDHYHRFREDFDIAKSLGHNAHRFSIEWSRIEPKEGVFNTAALAHYRDVVRSLRERGIEPFVTVWHWTLPPWLAEKGGILAPGFPAYFARYAENVAHALKDDVRFWMTINEPEVVCAYAYLVGVWPPQKRSVLHCLRAMRKLAAAHRKAYGRIKRVDPEASVGAVMSMSYFESAGGFFDDAIMACRRYARNFFFLNRIRRKTDFIGLNYYGRTRIEDGKIKNHNREVSDMGWEIYPEGLYHVLKDLKRYRLPVYITENGLADAADAHRASFIVRHLAAMRRAMDEGVDVRSYLHWSLLDNFEWDKGFWPRFGLVEVDHGTLERRIRPSAWAYKDVIESWDA